MNYIKYWNNANDVLLWFRDLGVEAKLVNTTIYWTEEIELEDEYLMEEFKLEMGQTIAYDDEGIFVC